MIVSDLTFAMLEPEAVAVQLKDVNVVSEAIEQRACAYSKRQLRAIVEPWRGWRVFSVGRSADQATQPPRPCMQTVWNVLTIRGTRKLLKRLGAEAIIDPPLPTNRLGNWYAKLVFVRRMPLIICISERSLLPVIVEAREMGSVALGVTANRRVLGRSTTSLRSLASKFRTIRRSIS